MDMRSFVSGAFAKVNNLTVLIFSKVKLFESAGDEK